MANLKLLFMVIFLTTQVSVTLAQQWELDMNETKSIAKAGDKNIILVFSGSDWCVPCMKLEKEIWETEMFINYAKDNFVMVRADFPKRKANKLSKEQELKNAKLAEEYNPNGYFPMVVIMDENGLVLGNTGYEKLKPKEYIEHLNSYIK